MTATCTRRLDCPVDAIDQFWSTARTAKECGMTPQKAFPFSGEYESELTRASLPGDFVWWRTVANVVADGQLVEWDSNVAIVETSDGKKAVEC